MKITAVSKNQSFGLKTPVGLKNSLWWNFIDFRMSGCSMKAQDLARFLDKIGSPKTKLQKLSFSKTDLSDGTKKLDTKIILKVGSLFDKETYKDSFSQKILGNIDLDHMKIAVSSLVENIEKSFITSKTFIAAGKRMSDGIPLSENKSFIKDLQKINRIVPGYHKFKKKILQLITSSSSELSK